MKKLSDYFKKFTSYTSRSGSVAQRCLEAIKIFTGHELEKSQLKINNTAIFLIIHPTIKHHILQSKDQIVGYINNNPFGFKIDTIG